MLLFSIFKFSPLHFLLILNLRFSSTSTSSENQKIHKLKSCLEREGSNINWIFVQRNITSSRYNSINYQWNTRLPTLPLAYIVPTSTKDVQNAIRCGKANNFRIFAKSGGHSYEKHSFGDSKSIVVDLRKLSKIIVNELNKTAIIGSGALLAEIYWILWRNGKFGIPTASCTSVGIGGVTLGGGYGFWSKRFGLTSDNVIEIDFVDPNGDLLKVNKDSHSDLFWALLGGGLGNFGIVTKFKFKLFDAAALNVTHIQFTYGVESFQQFFKAFQTLNYNNRNGNAYIGIKGDETSFIVNIIDAGLNEADIKNIIDTFPTLTLRPVSVKSMNFIEITAKNTYASDVWNLTQTDYPKQSYRAKSYFSNKILNHAEISKLAFSVARIPSGIFVQFGSYGGAVNRILKTKTSFVHRDSLYMIQVGISTDGLAQMKWIQEFDNTAKILDNGESYQNYSDGELKDNFLKRYYGVNLRRLVEIKRRVDPDNYFMHQQSIPVSLPT